MSTYERLLPSSISRSQATFDGLRHGRNRESGGDRLGIDEIFEKNGLGGAHIEGEIQG